MNSVQIKINNILSRGKGSVLILGDMPERGELLSAEPFTGTGGVELTKILQETGFLRSECSLAYLYYKRVTEIPATELPIAYQAIQDFIQELQPSAIITLGAHSLSCLCPHTEGAYNSWRGSLLSYKDIPVVPTLSPESMVFNWENTYFVRRDFARAFAYFKNEIPKPEYSFIIQPSFGQTFQQLDYLLAQPAITLAVDIETRRSLITCIGLAWSATEAICIPLIDNNNSTLCYYSFEEEEVILDKLRTLLHRPTTKVIGQNFLYDLQYLIRFCGIWPEVHWDTMLAHHTRYPGLPKKLGFMASLYCKHYVYWKDDKNELFGGVDQHKLWTYNCMDCVRTFEIYEVQQELEKTKPIIGTEYGSPIEIQHSMIPIMLSTMLRGVRLNIDLKQKNIMLLMDEIAKRQEYINYLVGRELNTNSPKQMQEFFYTEMGVKVIFNKKTNSPTTDGDALDTLAKREPLLGPLIEKINETRQLRNALSFCAQPLDIDSRIRCSYNIAGTETFRLASSTDAFDFGTNLQNVTSGTTNGDFTIPNLRKLFCVDKGFTGGEFDLKAADAQVVAAEAEEWELLEILKPGSDFNLHDYNVSRWKLPRHICKGVVHGTNYGVSAFGMARTFGLSVKQSQFLIDDWFTRYPGIKGWQDQVLHSLMTTRQVKNKFGYSRFYFDRIDKLLPQALAWIPQSTIGLVTNLGIRRALAAHNRIQFLLQNHDASFFQWPSYLTETIVPLIISSMQVPIPYSRPLIIDVDYKITTESWGHCKD